MKKYSIQSINNIFTDETGNINLNIGGSPIVEVTYSDLVTLVTDSSLVIGQTYLLTDYMTTYVQPMTEITKSSGIIEPLFLRALDVNKFSSIAYSQLYPQDIIYYSFDPDTSFKNDERGNNEGVEGFTKGKIYRRIDTIKNNDIGTDWRHVKYDRGGVDKLLFEDYNFVFENVIKTYYLFNNVVESGFYGNYIDINFINNTITEQFGLNKIGNSFQNNLIEGQFVGVEVLDYFKDNHLAMTIQSITFGNEVQNNTVLVGQISNSQMSYETLISFSDIKSTKVIINNALNPTYLEPVVGGGTKTVNVFWDGTNWVCN